MQNVKRIRKALELVNLTVRKVERKNSPQKRALYRVSLQTGRTLQEKGGERHQTHSTGHGDIARLFLFTEENRSRVPFFSVFWPAITST